MGGAWPAGLILLALTGCSLLAFLKPPATRKGRGESTTVRGPAFAEGPIVPDPSADWPSYNGSRTSTRFSPLADIDTTNVARLTRTCRYRLGERAAFQSGPVVVGGTLFVTTAEWTYAIDAATCRLRWKHRYQYGPRPTFDLGVNRGVAYADGRLFRGANDARLYALDAATGKELWNVLVGSVELGETVPAAPIAWEGRVYVGNAGGDNFGVRGRMMAFDQATGGRLWSQELLPRAGPASTSWPAETELRPRTGGTTWVSYTLDTLRGRLFLGTGNPGPDFLPAVRSGDNLLSTSVVELDARDGTLIGWRQLVRGDWHDWDLAAPPMLLTTRSGQQLVVQAGKDGFVHALDRVSGAPLYQTAVTTRENTEAPLTAEGTRFCPGVNGGVEWNGPAYARTANLLVVGAIDWCTTVQVASADALEARRGLPWTGSAKLLAPFGVPDSTRRGWLTALDAEDGRVRWRYASPTPLVAGVTATAGGLVFTGDLSGRVLAFSADSGVVLWRDSTRLPVGGGVVTYRAGGRQRLAVAAGMHAPLAWQLESPEAEVLVYSLPESPP